MSKILFMAFLLRKTATDPRIYLSRRVINRVPIPYYFHPAE